MLSYYQILQIKEDASQEEIKKAYRKLSKMMHPDFHGNSIEANALFILLNEAYETLSNSERRKKYNPHTDSSALNSFTQDQYDKIIQGYTKIVKDYEKIIRDKDKREKDLLNQISQLKKDAKLKKEELLNKDSETRKTEQLKKDNFDNDLNSKSTQNVSKTNKSKGKSNFEIVFWIVFATIILTVFILFKIYPFFMSFLLIVILIITWLYKLFKI